MSHPASDWWRDAATRELAQGDLFFGLTIPVLTLNPLAPSERELTQGAVRANFIIMTQSCDLQNNRAQFVALCATHSLHDFEAVNPEYNKKGRWEMVRKGRVEGLHLLASPEFPNDNRTALVVDFGHIVSAPFAYLSRQTEMSGNRSRLQSPFLEHFSQSFARFFMRVGLPTQIPPFLNAFSGTLLAFCNLTFAKNVSGGYSSVSARDADGELAFV